MLVGGGGAHQICTFIPAVCTDGGGGGMKSPLFLVAFTYLEYMLHRRPPHTTRALGWPKRSSG